MGLENYGEGLRAVLNIINNPAALRQIQALPESVAGSVGQTLRAFESAAKSGLLGDAAKQKILYGGPAPKAPPIPTKSTEVLQPSLALKTRTGKQVTSTVPRPTVRNRETLENLARPRVGDMPRVPRFGGVPGQLPLNAAPVPEFSYSGPYTSPRPEWGPTALPLSVREADAETLGLLKTLQPGAADSLSRLADDLAAEYGVPAGEALKNITGPQGTDYLAYLNTSRRAAEGLATPITGRAQTYLDLEKAVPGMEAGPATVRTSPFLTTSRSTVTPAVPAGAVPGGPGGARLESLATPITGRAQAYLDLERAAGALEADPSLLRTSPYLTTSRLGAVPGGPGGARLESLATPITGRAQAYLDLERAASNLGVPLGAVPSATQNLAKMVARSGLSRAQLAGIAGGAGAVGLAAGVPLFREEKPDPSLRLTDDQLYPQASSTETRTPSAGAADRDSAAVLSDRSVPPAMAAAGGGLSVAGQTGSGQVVVPQDDRESNYRQARANALAAVPKAPSEFAQIGDYYRAREAYASQPEVRAQLAREASMLPGAAPQTPTWAAANPTLAYEMIQRAKARPDLSQQTPQAQGMTVGAQMGDNSNNNFIGNVESAGSAVVDRSSGAADLEDATRPLVRPTLNRIPLGGRLVPLGGGYPAVPFG